MDGPFLALLVDLDYLVKKVLLQMGQVCHSYQIGYLAFLVGQELVKVEKLLCWVASNLAILSLQIMSSLIREQELLSL